MAKLLGMVSAYAYAVSKGYTGTEDQFATLMASYADVGQTAVDAALAASESEQAAAASETAAAGSASAAATSASTAGTAATTATTKAGEATTAATTAGTAASTATTKASEAAQSATAAAGSATTAGTSATAAQTAQTAAETAQTAAETAQAAAEAAAQTLVIDPTLTQANQAAEAKATGDAITLVKSHLNATEIVDTASGAIATFADGSDGVPVKSLTVQMEPTQDLHGQANPYPAGGGSNKWDEQWEVGGLVNATGLLFTASDRIRSVNFCACISGESYYCVAPSSYLSIFWYDLSQGFISWAAASNKAVTAPDNAAFFKIVLGDGVSTYSDNIAINYPATVTTYSPYSNICPISGRTEVTVTRAGKNLFDVTDYTGLDAYLDHGQIKELAGRKVVYIPCLPNTAYTVSRNAVVTAERFAVAYTTVTPAIDVRIYGQTYASASQTIGAKMSITITTGADAAYLVVWAYWTNTTSALDTLQIELGSTATAYEPGTIQSVTIPLGQTVYGGTVDVTTGEMVVDRAMVDMGTLTWSASSSNPGVFSSTQLSGHALTAGINVICSHYLAVDAGNYSLATMPDKTVKTNATYADYIYIKDSAYTGTSAADFKTAMSGVQVCYYLAEPLTVQLVGQSMTTLKGANNIWSDAGDVDVSYVADTKLYIEQLTEPDADMIADANITSGQYFMVGNGLYLATANIASGATISPGVNCTRTNLAAALNAINA